MEWLEASPPWVQVPAQELGAQIRALQAARSEPAAEAPEPASAPAGSWREKIWTVHPDTRLRRDEVCEALGKSTSWLYKKTSAREIPCRLDGASGYRASDFPGHLTGVSWWGPEDRRSGDGELNVVG